MTHEEREKIRREAHRIWCRREGTHYPYWAMPLDFIRGVDATLEAIEDLERDRADT